LPIFRTEIAIMSKLPHLNTSIFSIMSKMAVDYNAINLSQGFPNFPIDERMVEITMRLAKADVHQYTPMAGYPPLMEKICRLTFESYGLLRLFLQPFRHW